MSRYNRMNSKRTLLNSISGTLYGVAWALVGLGLTTNALRAQVSGPAPGSPSATQFDIAGLVQEATLDNPFDILSSGTIKVNGHVVVVPRNLVVIMPAAA